MASFCAAPCPLFIPLEFELTAEAAQKREEEGDRQRANPLSSEVELVISLEAWLLSGTPTRKGFELRIYAKSAWMHNMTARDQIQIVA